MTDPTAARTSRADRILVAVAVVSFWATVVLVPLMLAWAWHLLGEGHFGSQKDPRLLLAVTLVPLSPCFATIGVGFWHIRYYRQFRRPLRELDLLPIVSAFCIAMLATAVLLEF
jgi:hypothetical protein